MFYWKFWRKIAEWVIICVSILAVLSAIVLGDKTITITLSIIMIASAVVICTTNVVIDITNTRQLQNLLGVNERYNRKSMG